MEYKNNYINILIDDNIDLLYDAPLRLFIKNDISK